MSYLDTVIGANEKLIYTAKIHWVVYLEAILLTILGIIVINYIEIFAYFLFALAFYYGAVGFIYSYSTDLAVTDRKVIAKWGLIRRNTIEQRLDKVDAVEVHQSILGRILGYGSILVKGSGVTASPFRNISNPVLFRRALENAEDMMNAKRG